MVRFWYPLCVIILFVPGSIATDRLTTIICSKGCPFGSECDRVSEYCQCTADYPVLVIGGTRCLPFKRLGEECFHSTQCSHIENADCISSQYDLSDQTKKCRCSQRYFKQDKDNRNRCDNILYSL